jgi:hypothetical protein
MAEETSNAVQGNATGQPARKLTTHQQAVLIQVLTTFPNEPVGVCYLVRAAGALNYANDFMTIFKAIDWTIDRVEAMENLPAVPGGLAIVVNENQLPASAEALRDALRIYGIEAEIVRDHANLCGSRNFVLAITHV